MGGRNDEHLPLLDAVIEIEAGPLADVCALRLQNDLGQHSISPHPEEAPAVVKLFGWRQPGTTT